MTTDTRIEDAQPQTHTRCICEFSYKAQPYLPYTPCLPDPNSCTSQQRSQQLLLQLECHVLALQELEIIAGPTRSDSQDVATTRQGASAVEQLLGSAAASKDSSAQDLAMQSTSSEFTSPQLVAARNMHQENDERFDEITKALEQDLHDSPNRYDPKEGAPYHPLHHPSPYMASAPMAYWSKAPVQGYCSMCCATALSRSVVYTLHLIGTSNVCSTRQAVTGQLTFLTAKHVLSLTWPSSTFKLDYDQDPSPPIPPPHTHPAS